ncbi:MAG TPA: wax ester/triacylglycerol synthase family O-acyltransferase [Acidimicrobiales bacterium]
MAGMDAAFLYMETPSMHMHVVGVLVLDPGAGPDGFSLEKLTRVLSERIHLIPPLRRRLLPSPAGIDHPLWIEDPDFDLAEHVRVAPAPGPMSWTDLEAFTGAVAGRPLDRSRPLWEMWLAELEGGAGVALVSKLHHSLMDGGAGADLMASIFDLTPDGDWVAPPESVWTPDAVPSTASRVTGSVTSLVARQRHVPAALAHTVSGVAGTARAWVSERRAGNRLPLTAPATPFNGSLTARRSVSLARVDLDAVLAIRRAFGTTVNDVVLAASATALRDYLAARGVLPRRDLVAAVPVSAHRPDDDRDLVNKVSSMMVPLPLTPDDPVERLAAVHANAQSSKALQNAFGPDSLQELTGFTLPPVMTAAARLYSGLGLARFHPAVMNLVISNVPGPPIDLYCAGAKVTGIFPMGPVMEGSGVNITVLSEARHLNIGIMACPDLLDDVDELARYLVEAVDELADRARNGGGSE